MNPEEKSADIEFVMLEGKEEKATEEGEQILSFLRELIKKSTNHRIWKRPQSDTVLGQTEELMKKLQLSLVESTCEIPSRDASGSRGSELGSPAERTFRKGS